MRVQLDRVREEPFSWQEELDFAPEMLDRSEISALGAVTVTGQLLHTDSGFVLRGRVEYEQTLSCDRCLSPTVDRVATDFDLVIVAAGQDSGALEDERELDDDDLSVVEVGGQELDTEPLVLEQIQLNVPMKPLCSNDCVGLCVQCGANLRAGDCGCSEPVPDARWSALAGFRDQLPGGGNESN